MTIYAVAPYVNSNSKVMVTKPQRVLAVYQFDADALHNLISQFPAAIYFSDDLVEDGFEVAPGASLSEEMTSVCVVYAASRRHPHDQPVPWESRGTNESTPEEARARAAALNEDATFKGQYHFFPVRVTTIRKFEGI